MRISFWGGFEDEAAVGAYYPVERHNVVVGEPNPCRKLVVISEPVSDDSVAVCAIVQGNADMISGEGIPANDRTAGGQ